MLRPNPKETAPLLKAVTFRLSLFHICSHVAFSGFAFNRTIVLRLKGNLEFHSGVKHTAGAEMSLEGLNKAYSCFNKEAFVSC